MAIVAVLVIFILDRFSDWVERTAEEHYQINATVARYLLYIDQDVGFPPDLKKAEQISAMIDVELVISSKDFGHWPDDEKAKQISQMPFKNDEIKELPTGYRFASYQADGKNDGDDETYRLTTPDQTLYISWSYSLTSLSGFNKALLSVIGILLFTLLCCYLIIRYLISPVNLISRNVQRFAQGEMQQRIKTTRKDELGELATHINNMEDQITSMLDAKRQLLLGISHELRTPLTRAKLSLAMLPVDQSSQDLERDLNEMEAQINDLLESERLNRSHQSLNRTPVSINQLIDDVIQTYFTYQQFELELPEGDPYVLIDAPRICLLIKNLLSNAIKYADDQSVQLKVSLTDSALTIKVADRGPGIRSEHLKRLTEPFYRPDNARTRLKGGAGLGLYLCRLIAQAHEGELIIKSTVGIGSEFTTVLPLNPQSNK